MIEFLAAGALMIVLCVSIVLVPLWRQTRQTADRRREANVEVYRQRCLEIDREVALGRAGEDEASIERDALGMRLLSDVDAAADDATARRVVPDTSMRRRPWLASVLSVCLIVFGSVAAYAWLGDWNALNERGVPNVDQLMADLRAAIVRDPGDRRARLMLAQAEQDQGDYAGAAQNLRVINQSMKPPDVRLLEAEAQMLMAAGGDLSGRAGDLYARVLAQDPQNINSLWYLGLRSVEANEPRQAVGYWNRLLQQDVPPQVRRMVTSRRNALAGQVPGL